MHLLIQFAFIYPKQEFNNIYNAEVEIHEYPMYKYVNGFDKSSFGQS